MQRLRDSYAEIRVGTPVRLAKRTTNLFRPSRRARGAAPGLDVTGLDGVIEVDPVARTVLVQGMCTYETLLEATLVHGLMPLVVPQLRTITVGGAVTGLGIESTSLRNGLPHESVREMDVLTGDGRLITCSPGDDLFDAFPNSYGSLGYVVRLLLDLEPIGDLVGLRHLRYTRPDDWAAAVAEVQRTGAHAGLRVDAVDGVAFAPDDLRLTLATFDVEIDGSDWHGQTEPSDLTGDEIYFRTVRDRRTDLVTAEQYLWRWDTDWFWCSGALGLHRPGVRRLWPRRWRRSDVYRRIVGVDHRFDVVARLDALAGRPRRERVVQDVEIPIERTGEFLDWFDAQVGMRPVWLCPLRLRGDRTWPLYPLEPGRTYVNAGFWGTVPVGPDAVTSPRNRAVEAKVAELGGHKSLYSEAFYDRATFDRLYGGAHLAALKRRFDPEARLTDAYDKVVRER